ncbi:mitochondrial phosphate carrier protein 3, mitochondrial-like [Magnolia sinica]|uniref:mitochondrial phosphate carrier protein 3, mitochondrial-like n=1 Tax=Magnolia sinica TaxID=86752 RepID=UPI002658DF55|nr:mitochondrial phosphate carrier protein 3, mitochondrial-like [Magnolia sinica]
MLQKIISFYEVTSVRKAKTTGIFSNAIEILTGEKKGVKSFFRDWVPTLLGYSAQGACKFGFYEFFKKYYSDIAGSRYAAKYKTLIYLVRSAFAKVIADVPLCPMEAVKVRVQTQPGFAKGFSDGFSKFVRTGALGLYKGLVPLWVRQIPCKLKCFLCSLL